MDEIKAERAARRWIAAARDEAEARGDAERLELVDTVEDALDGDGWLGVVDLIVAGLALGGVGDELDELVAIVTDGDREPLAA